jgi:hypothetical protein
MLILTIVSIIIGCTVSSFSGFDLPGWIAGSVIFLCGLPGALAISFIHGEVSYTQDRADYRQRLSDIAAAGIAEEHELAEDGRTDRIISTVKKNPKQVFHDNRQVHIHGRIH